MPFAFFKGVEETVHETLSGAARLGPDPRQDLPDPLDREEYLLAVVRRVAGR